MKKPWRCAIADLKISALAADASPTSDDLIPTVNDPAGTPANKKVTLANAITKAHGLSNGAVVSVVAGVMDTSAVTATATELNYVSGVTSAIQAQITAKQAGDATLTALAAYNTNGLVAQTAADTFAGRTVTGTANQISVANGDGVAGNPTLSLPADVIIPTVITAPNTGLHILDTNASHDLIVAPGSDLTADHTLTVTTGDADRTLTISGNATVSQDYSTAGSPQFTGIELGHASDTTVTRVSAGVAAVEGKNIALNGTSEVLTTGTIELGAASDTTLSRSAAGVLAVEGVVIPSISSTNTYTNKRITKRTGSAASSATPTINTDNVDMYLLTAQAVDITSFTTNLSGTPTEGQTLWIAITGTAARAITWGTSFEASTVALPTTTVSTNRLDVGFVWNTVSSKWRCIASA